MRAVRSVQDFCGAETAIGRGAIAAVLAWGAAGCASPANGPANPFGPEPGASTCSPAEGPYQAVTPGEDTAGTYALDASLAEAGEYRGAHKVKIRVGAGGAVYKSAVYHKDEAVIPKPVRDLVAATYPGATVEGYETEWYRDMGSAFEVEVALPDGSRCELAATAEGKELYRECRVEPSKLPAPVRDAALQAASGGDIVEAEHKTAAIGTESFTLEVKHEGTEHYIRVSAAGELLDHTLRIPAVLEVPASR